MSLTQFAMVEELAFLVKDNLHSKHLVLSMEEAFVNFLQEDESSSDGILELEPMDPYNRLLLHRLADIFGFAHASEGEGDNRHLVLKRCPETSLPSVLVSDILFQNDEPQSLTASHQLLRRNDASSVFKAKSPSLHTFEEKEAAYLAARERIFSMDVEETREPVKQKPRNVPIVARRMIAHALGQKISPWNQDATVMESQEHAMQTNELNFEDKDKIDPNSRLEAFQETIFLPSENIKSFEKVQRNNHKCGASSHGQRNSQQELAEKSCTNISISQNGKSRNGIKDHSKEEHLGAAKRMFAHALGLHSARGGSVKERQWNRPT